MANPRIQNKRGANAPTSGSGLTAGEFAIQLGTGPNGPFNLYVGISGSTEPKRVGSEIIENFNNASNNNVPTTLAVQTLVNTLFTSQSLGVCFMEGPAPGQGTIDIKQSLGNSNSGFSGLIGVTFSISFEKTTSPVTGDPDTDDFGGHYNHRILLGDVNDGFAPKSLKMGRFLGYVGHCGGDVTINEFGVATVTKVFDYNNGGIGFTAMGLTYGEVLTWTSNATGWTAHRINGATGIDVISHPNGGITLTLEPLSIDPSGSYGNSTNPVQIPFFTIDQYGRVISATDANLSLYNLSDGFTGYVTPIFNYYFNSNSTAINLDSISTNFVGDELYITNTGVTGIQINGTYYTGGIKLSAGTGITLTVAGDNPNDITIGNLGVVGASGYISFHGHTQGNVHLANATGSQNLVLYKGGYRTGFDPNTGTCGYAVFIGLSSGIELPSNILSASNAYISIPTGFTGYGGFGGVCFGSQIVTGGTGGARGFLEVNRIQATGSNKLTAWPSGSCAGTVLELFARGGTESGQSVNTPYSGRNAKIVLASFPSDQWNLLTNINGIYDTNVLPNGYQKGGPNRVNNLPGITLDIDVQSGTVRLYNNVRVEKHIVVGGNAYVLGNYFDNTGATLEFTKLAYIANNNFLGTNGTDGFQHPSGATFGYGIITLGASGNSASDSGILYNFKRGSGGPTAAFFGYNGASAAFVARVATTQGLGGITGPSGIAGPLNLASSATVPAPVFFGAVNGITLGFHTGNTSASILFAAGHRLGLCGAFGLTFSVSANNTVIIPAEAVSPTTLVTLTNTQTLTSKTLSTDCVIDCGLYT